MLDAIVEALGPLEHKTVVEIGPGRGALTDRLVALAKRVVAVELDRDLSTYLSQRYRDLPHVSIVQGDVLRLKLAELGGSEFVLAGNVPYYITTPILFHALERPRPVNAVYLVQREVGERMAATPGSKTYGALSVNIQAVAGVELLKIVPPGAFQPPPRVQSAVVRLVPRAKPAIDEGSEDRYRGLVISAFGLRRKQLLRVVRTIASTDAETAGSIIARAQLDPMARPETLSPADFARLLHEMNQSDSFSGKELVSANERLSSSIAMLTDLSET